MVARRQMKDWSSSYHLFPHMLPLARLPTIAIKIAPLLIVLQVAAKP
jgi:hypothetical protein